jgi:hypothetical protein
MQSPKIHHREKGVEENMEEKKVTRILLNLSPLKVVVNSFCLVVLA